MSGQRYLQVADTTVTPPPENRPDPLERLKYYAFKITRDFGVPDETALLLIAEHIGDITPYATGKDQDAMRFADQVRTLALKYVAEHIPERIRDAIQKQALVPPHNSWADSIGGCNAFADRVRPAIVRHGYAVMETPTVISLALGVSTKSDWKYWPLGSDEAERRVYDYLKELNPMTDQTSESRITAIKAVLDPLYKKWGIDTTSNPYAVSNYLKACFNQMDFKALCESPDPKFTPEYISATFDAYVAETAKGKEVQAKQTATPAGDEIPFVLDASALQAAIDKHPALASGNGQNAAQGTDSHDEPNAAPVAPAASVGKAIVEPASEIIDAEPTEAELKTFKEDATNIVRMHHPTEIPLLVETLKADWEGAWEGKSSLDALKTWGQDEAIKRLREYLDKPVATSTALTVVDTAPVQALVPQPPAAMGLKMPTPEQFQMMQSFATAVARSGLYKDVNTVDKAFVILWRGFELGISFGTALDDIYIISGKPYPGTKILKGLVEASGQVQRFEVLGDERSATVTVQRKGRTNIATFTYSIDDAEKGGLLGKDNWKKSPKKMLKWRACRDAILMEFPDIAAGIGMSRDDEDDDLAA